jgi:hypothetical protein
MATDIIARAIGKSAKDKTDKITVNNNINLDIVSSTLAEKANQADLTALDTRVDKVAAQLAEKANQADLTALDTRVDTIITTPVDGVSAQEIIDARQGAATLGANIEAFKNDYTTYKDSNNLKIAKIEKDLNDYQQTMSSINPNQEATQKATGYGIVSLPKNAANGQISDVVVKGLTVTNLLEDGEVLQVLPPRPTSGIAPVFFDNLNLPQDKYLIFYELVQTVETFTLNSPYYNIVNIANTDPDNKTKNNTVGRKVWKLDAPETITKIGWRVYDTESEVHVKNFMVVKATEEDWNLTEGELIQKYSFITGTKSTVGAMRLKSVSADETEISTAYVVAKDEQGKIAELRSLPNGVKDEVRVSEGKLIKRISDEVVVDGNLNWTQYTHTNIVDFYSFSFDDKSVFVYEPLRKTSNSGIGRSSDGNYVVADLVATNNKGITFDAARRTYIRVEKTKIDSMEGTTLTDKFKAYLNQYPITLTYQLATPIEIPIQTSGSLVSYPSGTVYIEPFVADAGIYTDKMTVLHQDLPIKALEKLSKIDFMTGLETELDNTAAVIAEDKLSFTHPDLVDDDIVFFTYEYDRESTEGETEIATPTTVLEQEIIDARQGKASLGENLTAIKDDITQLNLSLGAIMITEGQPWEE